MKNALRRLVYILLIPYLLSISSPIILAANPPIYVPPGVPVSGSTPFKLSIDDTTLTVQGCASPNAFVTLLEDNTPIGTVVADSAGRFEKSIIAQGPGLKNIKAYFDDVNGRTSSTITQNISLAAHKNTVMNLLLPTTIEHEPDPVNIGEYLVFRGTTCPFSLVNVTLDNNYTLAAKADDRGNWYVIALTDNFFLGQHTYQALSSVNSSISQKTEKYQFGVVDPNQRGGGTQTDPNLTAPQILDPLDGYLTSTPNVLVSGIGPTNTQIEIIIDGIIVGSIFTNSIGEWSFDMYMNANKHVVQARACHDDGCSELSNSVSISYIGDFNLCSITYELDNYRFWGLKPDNGVNLDLLLHSGSPEFDVLIDWGDITVEHVTLYRVDPIKLHHVYKELGQYNGIITVKDSSGCTHTQYFSVDVSDQSSFNPWWLLLLPALLGLIWVVYENMGYRERRARLARERRIESGRPHHYPPIKHFPTSGTKT